MSIKLFSHSRGHHFELEVELFSLYVRVGKWDWFGQCLNG
jgi:hypothetical protein